MKVVAFRLACALGVLLGFLLGYAAQSPESPNQVLWSIGMLFGVFGVCVSVALSGNTQHERARNFSIAALAAIAGAGLQSVLPLIN